MFWGYVRMVVGLFSLVCIGMLTLGVAVGGVDGVLLFTVLVVRFLLDVCCCEAA